MNFQEFVKKYQEKFAKATTELVKEMEKDYNVFWESAVAEVIKQKSALSQDVATLTKDKNKLDKELDIVSTEILSLHEGVKSEKEKLAKYQKKQQEILNNVMDLEKKEIEFGEREKDLEAKESAINEKEQNVKILLAQAEEKQRSIKKAWENVNKF